MSETFEPATTSQAAASVAHFEVTLRHRIGDVNLDVAFQLTQPWTMLFAPSGAGKTTILRAIAGLIEPLQARIVSHSKTALPVGGNLNAQFVLTDSATGINTPPHHRAIRMVSEKAALFPHMDVMKNIRYAALLSDRKREARQQIEGDLQSLLSLCRVDHLAAKMPPELSAGQRQRVALARSLAGCPCNLLLLDEPFTGLDANLRDKLIADLKPWLARRNTPVLSVTHNIAEAFQLGAEVIKLHDGRIIEQGPAAIVLAKERLLLLSHLSR